MNFIALHGFLGSPSDWSQWKANDFACKMFMPVSIDLNDSLEGWAEKFNQKVFKELPSPRILMGYSMGGRLALHALLNSPHIWAGGVLISTHMGLLLPEERQKRLIHDQGWAKRFLNDPWDLLMEDWESQSIFQNAQYRFKREEINRLIISKQIINYSLGHQKNLNPFIEKLKIPILWVTGANDLSFSAQAERICLNHNHSVQALIPHAGHRAPWESPDLFTKQVKDFIYKKFHK